MNEHHHLTIDAADEVGERSVTNFIGGAVCIGVEWKMSDDEYGNEDTRGFGDGDFNEYNDDALNDLEENEFAEVLSSHAS